MELLSPRLTFALAHVLDSSDYAKAAGLPDPTDPNVTQHSTQVSMALFTINTLLVFQQLAQIS
jgi:hypothetical protein